MGSNFTLLQVDIQFLQHHLLKKKKKDYSVTSLVVQWLRLRLPRQRMWVRSLVREISSHMPRRQKNQNIKQKQYCNKFNKDFKNGPHQKKKSLKKDYSLFTELSWNLCQNQLTKNVRIYLWTLNSIPLYI